MKIDAYFLAASTLAVAWMRLSFGLTMLEFFIHPSAVVLSVMERTQPPGLRCLPMMLIQAVMIAARNLSK
jgi:hypothetical protein